MAEHWKMLFPTFHESQLMPWSTPQEINGSDTSFRVHVDETPKMTWVGYKKWAETHMGPSSRGPVPQLLQDSGIV